MGTLSVLCLLGNCNGGEPYDQTVMNFVEVTSLLLPAILLIVLFVRMKIQKRQQSILQSYSSTDIFMQPQQSINNEKLPFTKVSMQQFWIWAAIIIAITIICISNGH